MSNRMSGYRRPRRGRSNGRGRHYDCSDQSSYYVSIDDLEAAARERGTEVEDVDYLHYIVYGHYHLYDDDYDFGTDEWRPRPEPQPVPDVQDFKDVLSVEKVDYNVAQNVKKHNTQEYDITEGSDPKLVVRRGQEFTIKIDFSRQYNVSVDDLRLVFQIGQNPMVSKGTHVEFVLSDEEEKNMWGAKIAQQSGKSMTITVFTPPDCFVGKWYFLVDVVKRKDNQTAVLRYSQKDPVYVLFNPWCKDDAVYLENPSEREAYVLREVGQIYMGTKDSMSKRAWAFGQFSGNVLDCCLYLLNVSNLKPSDRGNPVRVVRKVTAMVNKDDDFGVLEGNWSGDYKKGKKPSSWTGSAEILEQYYKERSPVKYGQCWVFAGVLNTVLRALGIPARCVTNFESAHDSDASITLDLHYDSNGEAMADMDDDSLWNFHVWNEAWMTRPDLQPGYGGWQACDATPQETSDGVYCCGPCPVRAIKEGEVNQPFDGPFVFAEVNADKLSWMVDDDGSTKLTKREEGAIGLLISTLAVNGEDREDITNNYKYPENSPEERAAVLRAIQLGSSRKELYKSGPEDVDFQRKRDADHTVVGEDLVVKLNCVNKSQEQRTIEGMTKASTMYYTGVVAHEVGKEKINAILQPGEAKEVTLRVKCEDYQTKLKDFCMLSVSSMVRVAETKQIFTDRYSVRLLKPELNIKAPNTATLGEEFEVQVSFPNPLACTLTDCSLAVDGPGLTQAKKNLEGDVSGKGLYQTTLKLKPVKGGTRLFMCSFNSRQLEEINGLHLMVITD